MGATICLVPAVPMPDSDVAASGAGALSRKHRLHPLAIVFPFSSYSRPPLLGRAIRVPRWAVMSFLFVVVLIVDYFSTSVTVQDDGAILVRYPEFSWEALTALAAVVGSVTAWLFVRWWSFRWWIADDAIWTSGGLVNRWQRRVTFARIVTVDRLSTPLRRMFRVSSIAIETTAVDRAGPDVLLGYLSHRDANLLEHLLIARLAFAGEDDKALRFDPLAVDRLGWWELIVAGAMTLQIGRAVVIVYAVSFFVLTQLDPTVAIEIQVTSPGWALLQYLLAPLLGAFFVLWLVSTAYFVISFARFTLGKHAGWLILETGVIRRSRRLIDADAIQGLEIARSPLQRAFRSKRAMLRMRLPAYGAPPRFAMVLHPAVTDATIPTLTQQVAGMDPATSAAMCGKGVHPLAAASRRAYLSYWPLRIAAFSGVVLAMLLVFQPRLWWVALLPLILAAPLAGAGWLAWRSAGWFASDGAWLLAQRGAFTLTSTAARVDRIQYVRWSQGLFSSAGAVASLAMAVATSGGASLLSRILAILRRPVDPSLVRLRAVDATNAEAIARALERERLLSPR